MRPWLINEIESPHCTEVVSSSDNHRRMVSLEFLVRKNSRYELRASCCGARWLRMCKTCRHNWLDEFFRGSTSSKLGRWDHQCSTQLDVDEVYRRRLSMSTTKFGIERFFSTFWYIITVSLPNNEPQLSQWQTLKQKLENPQRFRWTSWEMCHVHTRTRTRHLFRLGVTRFQCFPVKT